MAKQGEILRSGLLILTGIAIGLLLYSVGLAYVYNLPFGRQAPVSVTCTANISQSEIFLPSPSFSGIPLEEALKERRSARIFSNDSLSLKELSQLLFAGQGITEPLSGFRTAPSAGARYPMQMYVVPNRIEGAGCGIYRYVPQGHKLVLAREGEFSGEVRDASYGQGHVGNAAAVFIITAVPEKTAAIYGEDAERFVHIEAGHIAQNILLESVSLGLASSPIGSIYPDQLDSIIGINGTGETSVYVVIAGKKP
jgi:SagB-type dehydrogenase family enzyme